MLRPCASRKVAPIADASRITVRASTRACSLPRAASIWAIITIALGRIWA